MPQNEQHERSKPLSHANHFRPIEEEMLGTIITKQT